ncbi:MAG: hypothetical protein GX428_05180, partial [Candidatus Atribacteria bacterium]|nr:hypothetical protein [Candidatus Atribacteria bacterium]
MAYIQMNMTQYAAKLCGYVESIRNSLGSMQSLFEVMKTMVNGEDYTLLETMFGLRQGDGQVLYHLVEGSLQMFNEAC